MIDSKVAINENDISIRIYLIRGEKVMLDRDLAELYGVETKQLKRSVKRNIDRFPEDFMFQLHSEEFESLRCQIGTLKRGQHAKYLPYAFTEQGVAMLSGVLKSTQAVQVNIAIMRTFVKMRKVLVENNELAMKFKELETEVNGNSESIQLLFNAIHQLMEPEKTNKKKIGFDVREKMAVYKTKGDLSLVKK